MRIADTYFAVISLWIIERHPVHIPVFVVYHSLPFIAFEIGSNGTVFKNEKKKKYCLKESR